MIFLVKIKTLILALAAVILAALAFFGIYIFSGHSFEEQQTPAGMERVPVALRVFDKTV